MLSSKELMGVDGYTCWAQLHCNGVWEAEPNTTSPMQCLHEHTMSIMNTMCVLNETVMCICHDTCMNDM